MLIYENFMTILSVIIIFSIIYAIGFLFFAGLFYFFDGIWGNKINWKIVALWPIQVFRLVFK